MGAQVQAPSCLMQGGHALSHFVGTERKAKDTAQEGVGLACPDSVSTFSMRREENEKTGQRENSTGLCKFVCLYFTPKKLLLQISS